MQYTKALERLRIEDKDGDVVPFRLNLQQKKVVRTVEEQEKDGKPVRILILKARQMGLSTVTEGLIFVRSQAINGTKSLIIAHEIESSEHLLGMTKLFWESSLWARLRELKWNSRKEMAWRDWRSTIKIATAGNKNPGRSKTIRALHASELAFWDNATKAMLALNNAIPNKPNSMVVLESTANGIGNYFHQKWEEAYSEGDSEYAPLFFPWWQFPEYCLEGQYPELTYRMLDEEERWLRERFRLSDNQLYWRRWYIRNKCEGDLTLFHQEYPSTPEEAFISTGVNAFNYNKLRACYFPQDYMQGVLLRDAAANGRYIQWRDTDDGELKVFRQPSPDKDKGQYFLVGDATYTVTHDFATIQVINRRTLEQVAIWRGRIDAIGLAEELVKLGYYYNTGIICCETSGPGYATIGALVQMGYPFIYRGRWADKMQGQIATTYGWFTSERSKEWAIAKLRKLIIDLDIIIHDKTTFLELKNYQRLPGGGYGPAEGEGKGHDDTVMALAIAVLCTSIDSPLQPYGQGLEDILFGNRNQQLTPTWSEQLLEAV